MSRYAGTRYKARKLQHFTVINERCVYWVEITREELHVTKGWKNKHVFKKALDHHMWIQHPPAAEFFFPNDGWPAEKLPMMFEPTRLMRRALRRPPITKPDRQRVHAWQRKGVYEALFEGVTFTQETSDAPV